MNLSDVSKEMMSEEVMMLKDLSANLEQIINDTFVNITLKEFETYFLPFIIGNIERNEDNYLIYVNNYLKLTDNNYYKRLYVVDNKGEVLYKLPSIMLNSDTEEFKKINFNLLINAVTNDSPQSNVDAYVGLTAKAVNETLTEDQKVLQEQIYDLNKIFKDYKDFGDEVIQNRYGGEKKKSLNVDVSDDDIDDFLD